MFLVSLLLAGLMGYAIQRGATCTVAAVDEIVAMRRARRLVAMLEASLWVAGLLFISKALGFEVELPMGHPISLPAMAGALLLGTGAFINQACVFGAIARLGSGQWAYLCTPVGFYAGAWVVAQAMPPITSPILVSPLVQFPSALAWVAGLFMAYRLLPPTIMILRTPSASLRETSKAVGRRLWRPEAATAVIGITFYFLLVLEGPWAYTDILNEAAQGTLRDLSPRNALLLALLLGAICAGWTSGLLKSVRPSGRQLALCTFGGALMGAGSAMIPGSNDGLILLGMPTLFAHAWAALAAMLAAIAVLKLSVSAQ